MKKLYALILTTFIGVGALVAQTFGGGDGSAGTPYLISTPAHMVELSTADVTVWNSGNYFKMTADIDMAGTTIESIGYYSSVDGNHDFIGTFDGDYHVIKNLEVTKRSDLGRGHGLFGQTKNATVKNLGLVNFTVGADVAATRVGLVGDGYGGTTTITNCFIYNGNITGTTYTAGMLGSTRSVAAITNCYYHGTITGTSKSAGINGENWNWVGSSTITNCYFNGKLNITSGSAVSAPGTKDENQPINTNCYYVDTCGQSQTTVTELTAEEMLDLGNFTGFLETEWATKAAFGPVLKAFASNFVDGNDAPIADAGADQIVGLTDVVTLSAGRSSDVNGDDLTYTWSTTEANVTIDSPNGLTTTLTLNTPLTSGVTYEFTLSVDDGNGNSASDVVAVSYKNLPSADAGPDAAYTEGDVVTLDGSNSAEHPNETEEITLTWTAPAGIELSDVNAAQPTFTAPLVFGAQQYLFKLLVTTPRGDEAEDDVLITINPSTAPIGSYSGGTGAADNPILISTNADLLSLSETKYDWDNDFYYELTADLDMAGETFRSIGYLSEDGIEYKFKGQFNGKSHVISNLTVSAWADHNYALGFIGKMEAGSVDSLGIDNFAVSVNDTVDRVGAIVGEATSSTINNCFAINSFIHAGGTAGGIVGSSFGGVTIENCFFAGNVAGKNKVGGISFHYGWAANFSINNCINYGEVTSSDYPENASALIFEDNGDYSKITDANNFYLSTAGTDVLGAAVAPDTIDNAGAFTGLDLTDRWERLANGIAVLKSFKDLNANVYDALATVQEPVAAIESVRDTIFVSGTSSLEKIVLDGRPSSDPLGFGMFTYQWNMIEGEAGVEIQDADSSVAYFDGSTASATIYKVELTVTNGFDGVAANSKTVVVKIQSNQAPVADAGPDQTDVDMGSLVTLDGSASSDPDGDALTFAWSIVGDAVIELTGADTEAPTFTAPIVTQDSVVKVALVVSDGEFSAKDTVAISVLFNDNVAPVANAGTAQTVIEGATVTLDGSGSTDADDDALTYVWTMDQAATDAGIALSDAAAVQPTFTAPSVEASTAYTFTLVVNDGTVSSEPATVVITVEPTPNTAPVADAGDAQTVQEGATVTLDGSGSSDADSDNLTYAWTMDQAATDAGITLSDAAIVNPTFTAPDVTVNTDYTFTLVVNDGTVNSEPSTVTITVEATSAISNAKAVEFAVYPNPSNGLFTIETKAAVEVTVRDIVGRTVKTDMFGAGVSTLNITNQKAGLYILSVKEGDKVATMKLKIN